MLSVQDGACVPASALKVSDTLRAAAGGECVVLRIEEHLSSGYYAPLTHTGRIVVSGVVCSCYVENFWLEATVNAATWLFQSPRASPMHGPQVLATSCNEQV